MSDKLERQVQKWKLIAVAGFAFAAGAIVGPRLGGAVAQSGVMKVQLDTSNCTVTQETHFPNYGVPIHGQISGGAIALTREGDRPQFIWSRTTCR